MTLVDAVNIYLVANALLVVAALSLVALRRGNPGLRTPLSQRHLLHIGYALAVASLLLPMFPGAFDGRHFAAAPVQVWAGDTAGSTPLLTTGQLSSSGLPVAGGPSVAAMPVLGAAVALAVGGFLLWLLRMASDARRTWRLLARAIRLRRAGRAELYVSDEVDVPFSFWSPGRCFVVLPTALLAEPRHARLALRHEAQHHRQGDTRLVYLIQILRAAFLWNPAAHVLACRLLVQQELACDEAIVQRHQAVADGYYQCLLWAAGAAARRRDLVQLGMSGGSRNALLLRLGAVLAPPARTQRAQVACVVAIAASLALGFLSVAIAQPVADRRISMADAQRMLRTADAASQFPVVLNEAVLHELNALLGTRKGRAFVAASLERMPSFADAIAGRLERDGLPGELLAVPFVESGYVNRVAGENPRHGAGLWMFIEPTARRYGLPVGPEGDGRLDAVAATDAAARYLMDMHAHFGDWRLALLAYNVGAARVEAAIDSSGSRDAWVLAGKLYAGQTNYLGRVVAAALILSDTQRLKKS